MLNCQEVSTRASALIDGELGPWPALRMRLHLVMCKGCRRFIGQMRTTRELTEGLPATDAQDEAGADRIGAILSRLHDEGPTRG